MDICFKYVTLAFNVIALEVISKLPPTLNMTSDISKPQMGHGHIWPHRWKGVTVHGVIWLTFVKSSHMSILLVLRYRRLKKFWTFGLTFQGLLEWVRNPTVGFMHNFWQTIRLCRSNFCSWDNLGDTQNVGLCFCEHMWMLFWLGTTFIFVQPELWPSGLNACSGTPHLIREGATSNREEARSNLGEFTFLCHVE